MPQLKGKTIAISAPGSLPDLVARAIFQKYGLQASEVHIASLGSDLDRFSRYALGTFDNRLRGYPSALIRYDRGAVLRTVAIHPH